MLDRLQAIQEGRDMLFQRFEDSGLAQYSYVVGCTDTARAVVVDPRRDVDVYLKFARERGLEICAVLETHIHADYASGALELGQRADAPVRVSAYDEGERYRVRFPHEDLRHGDRIELGGVVIEVLHTPGHTPEHLSFLVYERSRSTETPQKLLSGDFLFVGSLGRPDLLGEDAKRELAEAMWESVRTRIADLPDGLQVHPGHGAGSMCGSGMSGQPSSTLGYERVANPFLDPDLGREEFVERLLSTVPPFPDYYRRMKEVNSEGPRILDGLSGTRPVDVERFRDLSETGGGDHVVVDVRGQVAFGGGHVPGAFGIGAGSGLSEWAGWTLPYDRPLLLVLPEGHGRGEAEEAVRALVRVGLDDVRGWLEGGMEAWVRRGFPLSETPQITPRELERLRKEGEEVEVVDVRTAEEWEAGHVAGARHLPGGEVPDHLEELRALDEDRPLAVICGSGYRSTVVASVLERAGFPRVVNVTGGMEAWREAGLPVRG